jgi:hypothetical protein
MKNIKTVWLLCCVLTLQIESKAQCNVNDTVNTFYKFLNPGGNGEFNGFLCSAVDSVGSSGLSGYYDGCGFSVKLLAGTEVIFEVDSCTGNPVSLTIVDSANTIIPGAYSPPACINSLDFTATYSGTYSVVMNVNGICGGAGTNLIGQVHVKIKPGTNSPSCSGIVNDTICGAIRLELDSGFSAGNTNDAYPSDPMDFYLDSIGATACSPPNNTMWYYFQSPVNIDTLNIWVTSGAGSGFHSWIVGFIANDTADFCTGGLTYLGCTSGAADEAGVDTMSFQLFGVQAGQVYVLMIDGFNGGAGPFSIAVKSEPFTIGVEEIQSDGFRVFPNPATGEFTIDCETLIKMSTVTVSDVFGKILFVKDVDGLKNLSVESRNFPAGIYIVTVQTEKSRFQKKVIVSGPIR